MKLEGELLTFTLPGVSEFSIFGPKPDPGFLVSPALARTSVTSIGAGVSAKLRVLSEAIESRSVSTTPFLFEQTTYHFHVVVESAMKHSVKMLLGGSDLLAGRRPIGSQQAYAVPVNFQSEVGYTDLEVWRGDVRLFALRLEVFPTKLDYRTDLLELRADLQMEVRSLVFELYGKTFQMLRRGARARTKDIDWLAMLREEFQRLIQALETIVRAPLQRVEATHTISRADRPSRPSGNVRQYLRRNARKCVQATGGHFSAHGITWISPHLPCVTKKLTSDTPENRFVAATLGKMRRRLRRLLTQLAGIQKRERFESWTKFLEKADEQLRHFQTRTFLAELPKQQAHISPTLALHLTPGYREFFSLSLSLESFLEVEGGPFELPEKDLSTLYELWCFIALAQILREELKLTVRRPSWLRVTQRRVALELVSGRRSVLSMEKNGEECLRVVYNRADSTPTGDCKPDNTLEIFKQGHSIPFRYIFDAKYRLQSDPAYVSAHFAPGPPADAVHRMHAYRDQIVAEQSYNSSSGSPDTIVWDLGYRQWVQQTVGAFVLYPYAGADAHQNRFFQAIGKVGVGGVPFLPSRRAEATTLLKQIIERSSEAVEDTAIGLSSAQERQRLEWAHEYGLIAVVPTPAHLNYLLKERTYHTPYDRHKRWGLRLRADFVLFILSDTNFPEKSGVAYQAVIKSVHFGERREISPQPPISSRGARGEEHYVWFQLEEVCEVTPLLKYVKPMPQFAFTTKLAFSEAESVAELMLIREPERRFYRECRNAGFDVGVYEESVGTGQVFDIGQLKLRFAVSQAGKSAIQVRFDPFASTFRSVNGDFTWTELMFRPEECLRRIVPGFTD